MIMGVQYITLNTLTGHQHTVYLFEIINKRKPLMLKHTFQ